MMVGISAAVARRKSLWSLHMINFNWRVINCRSGFFRHPFRPEDRHHRKVDAIAVGQAVGLPEFALAYEADKLVYTSCAAIADHMVQPKPMRFCFVENPINDFCQKGPSETCSGPANGQALETDVSMLVRQLAEKCETFDPLIIADQMLYPSDPTDADAPGKHRALIEQLFAAKELGVNAQEFSGGKVTISTRVTPFAGNQAAPSVPQNVKSAPASARRFPTTICS